MRQMRPTPANVKEDCCIDILGSTQLKFDVKVQLQDLPFPTPPSATSSTATALAHLPLPARRSNGTQQRKRRPRAPLPHSLPLTLIPPFPLSFFFFFFFFSLTSSRKLRSAGWPSRSLACSFVCRSALTTASSSPFCLVSLPPSKGTREPARRPPRPPTASQPSL